MFHTKVQNSPANIRRDLKIMLAANTLAYFRRIKKFNDFVTNNSLTSSRLFALRRTPGGKAIKNLLRNL